MFLIWNLAAELSLLSRAVLHLEIERQIDESSELPCELPGRNMSTQFLSYFLVLSIYVISSRTMDFGNVPSSATLEVKAFKAHVDEEKLEHFKELLKLSPIGPAVFENTNAGRRYGTKRDWLANAKKVRKTRENMCFSFSLLAWSFSTGKLTMRQPQCLRCCGNLGSLRETCYIPSFVF